MEHLIRTIVLKLFPEFAHGLHLLSKAKVVGLPAAIQAGQQSTDWEPRYTVDVRRLDRHGHETGPVYTDIPLPVPFAGHQRGQFAWPPVGTLVTLQYCYADPEHPVITAIYPTDRHLPPLQGMETLLQHSPATWLRSDTDENWDLRARNTVRLGNAAVDLTDQVYQLAGQLEALCAIQKAHTHPGVGPESQGGLVAGIEAAAARIKATVNQIRRQ